jgi:hypothetical protein
MRILFRTALLLMVPFLFGGCSSLSKMGLVPTEAEMILGLKDALTQGMFKSFDAFANPEGNALVRFAFPGEAAKIEKALDDLGLGSIVDNVTGKFTRAIGSAVQASKPVFVNSIKKLTIKDAVNILVTDNPHAATDYFKRTNKDLLLAAFRPVVDSTVKAENADVDWDRITTIYNAIPFRKQPLEKDLTDFISGRAIDVMCLIMANEEEQIRSKAEFRKTDIERKVFAWAETELKKRMAK